MLVKKESMLLVLLRHPHLLELDLVRKPTKFLLMSIWGFGSRVSRSYTFVLILISSLSCSLHVPLLYIGRNLVKRTKIGLINTQEDELMDLMSVIY